MVFLNIQNYHLLLVATHIKITLLCNYQFLELSTKSVGWGPSVFIPKIFDVLLGLAFSKTSVYVALITRCCIFIKSWEPLEEILNHGSVSQNNWFSKCKMKLSKDIKRDGSNNMMYNYSQIF